jgi:Na+/H+ antiporter NhaA
MCADTMNQGSADLPPEIADRFTKPLARFLDIEATAGAVLLLATFAALILSNSAWTKPFLAFWKTPIGLHFGSLDVTRSLRHWINDGLMTLFFFVVALAVEPQQVVLGQAESADRRLGVQATMRAMPVVALQPAWQPGGALVGILVSAAIGPFA